MNDVQNAQTEEEKMNHLLRMVSGVNDSNDAIILQDFEGKILAWNRGAQVIYGYAYIFARGTRFKKMLRAGNKCVCGEARKF